MKNLDNYKKILKGLGLRLTKTSKILDFGCGNGNKVKVGLNDGWDICGCDLKFKPGENVEWLERKGRIKLIDVNSYKLPFPDNSFDFVFSNQVFEHIQDYSLTLKELYRILKPGGIGLHFFASRYRIIEGHVHIPLASLIRERWWFYLWELLRNNKSNLIDTVQRKYQYIINNTKYYPKAKIIMYVKKYFSKFGFCESLALKYANPLGLTKRLRYLPFFPLLYSTFQTRVLYTIKSPSLNHFTIG